MALQSDFMVAVNQLAAERGLDVDDILESIKYAIISGYRRNVLEDEEVGTDLNVEIDSDTGEIVVFADKKVVKEVTNPATQIDIKEAQALEPKLKEGDHVEVDITEEGDFGRVAAQAAKQVILQKLREAEKNAQIQRFVNRIGEIETGIVQRMDRDSVIWELNKAIAIMPADERIPFEFYKSGAKHKVLLKEIQDGPKGKNIIVSRSDPDFVKALFALEVPELLSETVEIKGIAREAGQRTKVAVTSNVEGIDPIGACVGQKGARIMAIMNELKIGNTEEKVDIILWDEDIEHFVINSLSPAQVVNTKIVDNDEKIIEVIVPDEQLSLAIGREGQNVRLAAKLTGWNIDIQGETVKVENEFGEDASAGVTTSQSDDASDDSAQDDQADNSTQEETSEVASNEIESLGLSARVEKALDKAGINSIEELKGKIDEGEKIAGVGPKAVEEIKKALK